MNLLPPSHVLRATILVVDDLSANREVLRQTLESQSYEVLAAPDGETALRVAAKATPDVILLDVMMPGINGFETCRRLKSSPLTQDIPVIFISARHETESMVGGFAAGGVDYITKPFQSEEVLVRVRTHLTNHRLTKEILEKNQALESANQRLREEINRRQKAETSFARADAHLSLLSQQEVEAWGLPAFVGRSPAMKEVTREIRNLQLVDSTPVIITGESGTGKELVARALHYSSRRNSHPFIPVNCAAIPEELAESLFFGHLKGAFTGAQNHRRGYFEMADTGSLFLDEIGDMPLSLQAKLLRVLENGTYLPVGASQEKKADVRLIAATNADLHQCMEQGSFRKDLFFRISGYQIKLKPLRERREDVELLGHHFLEHFARELNRPCPAMTDAARDALQSYHFPGNIRELKSILERALIESRGGLINDHHLHLLDEEVLARSSSSTCTIHPQENSLPLNLQAAQVELVKRALHKSGGNVSKAAEMLGINRTKIYRILSAKEPEQP